MTSRERIDMVFDGGIPDRVPIAHIGFSSRAASIVLGREAYVGGGIQQWREAQARWSGADAHTEFLERSYRDAVDLSLAVENDILRVNYWRCRSQPTRRIDDVTFGFEAGEKSGWTIMRYDPESEQAQVFPMFPSEDEDAEARRLREEEKRMGDYRPNPDLYAFELRALAEYGNQAIVRMDAVSVGIPHEARWMEWTVTHPDLVERHLDIQAERACRHVEFFAKAGFRYLFGGYDFASQEGPMISPAVFRRLVLPRLRRVSDCCARFGCKHLFASDGNLWPVAKDLFAKSGIAGYYEIDRRAGMDLRRLRREYPDLTLLGNISSFAVSAGSVSAARAEALDCLETARDLRRVVVGLSNYATPETPPENLLAMLACIRENRGLPLR